MQIHNDGRRSNAAVYLLLPTLEQSRKGPNNLHLLTDKLVAKVLFKDNRAIGVEAIDARERAEPTIAFRPESRSARTITISAKKRSSCAEVPSTRPSS